MEPPDLIPPPLPFFPPPWREYTARKLADEEKVIKGYLYGERLQVRELQALQQSVHIESGLLIRKQNFKAGFDQNKIFALLK